MRYIVMVEVTEIYEVSVEADGPEQAEKIASDMEYSDMLNTTSTVSFDAHPVGEEE